MQALDLIVAAGFPIDGLIHVGANDGQERYAYLASGADPCVYVEPIDGVFNNLKTHISDMPGHIAVQAVCSDVVGEHITFNIASNGGLSSSILPLGDHATYHPSIRYVSSQKMVTTTVDNLLASLKLRNRPNLMIIDTQGAEMKVLRGALKTFATLDAIFVEVSEAPLYEGGCTHEEITAFLKQKGFRLRWMGLDAHGHGDAFYCRAFGFNDDMPTYDGNKALHKPTQQSTTSIWSKPNGDASGAVSGKKTGGYGFHTDLEVNPWWQVDLGEIIEIREIRIFNRIDVVRERARTLQVRVSNDAASWRNIHDQAGVIFGGIDGRPLRITEPNVKARFVQVILNEQNYLHLDEVEVY